MSKISITVDIETYVEVSPQRLQRIGTQWVADAIQQKIERLRGLVFEDCHDRSVETDLTNGVVSYREAMR